MPVNVVRHMQGAGILPIALKCARHRGGNHRMRHFKSTLLGAATALCVAYAAPTFAQSSTALSRANENASFNRGAPGPLAGAGLPFLIVAGAVGAYKLIRRRQENRRRDDMEQG